MAIASTVNGSATATKKPVNLPLQDPNNPNQPLQIAANQIQPVASAQPQQSAGVHAAGQSLTQVNQMAQQGFQSPTVALTSQKTQELLKDPSQGMNYQQNINNRLTQADRENAQAVETARQGMAGAAGSSMNQQALMELALKGAEGKADLQTSLESEAAKQKQSAMIAALAEGRATSATEQNQYSANIDALVKARGAADTEMGLTQKTESEALNRGLELAKSNQNANLQVALANIDSATKQGLQVNQQDWQAAQNELDRQAQVALQSGDIQGQKDIAKLKNDLEVQLLVAQQDFTGAQNALDRQLQVAMQNNDIQGQKDIAKLKSDLEVEQMVKQQNWEGAQKALDRQLQTSLQANDLAATKENLQRQLDYDKQKEASGQAFTAEQNALNRTLEYTLKNLDIDSAKALTELKSKLDSGLLTQEQDWKGAQATLDRAASEALQKNDIQGQIEITKLKGELDAAQQKSQQQWNTGERLATQAYSTSERVSTQDYQTASKYLDQKLEAQTKAQDFSNSLTLQGNQFNQEATMAKLQAQLEESKAGNDYKRTEALTRIQSSLQAGLQDDAQEAAKELQLIDAANARSLAAQKAAVDLKMQTQEFDQQTKMLYLNDQLATAKANGDVERQKQIIQFQTSQDLLEISAKEGADKAIEKLRGDIQLALQDDDQIAVEALQTAEFYFKANTVTLDQKLQQAAIDLQKRGVDMALVDQQYNQISDLVEQGILDPAAEQEFILGTLKAHGIDTSGPEYQIVDSQEQAQRALNQEYELQKQQFMITHPEAYQLTWTVNGKKITLADKPGATEATMTSYYGVQPTKELTPEGLKTYNQFINSALYGELTDEQKAAKANAGYLSGSDISSAMLGDKFNITEATTFNGQSIPAGKYHTESGKSSKGNDFFGKTIENQLFLVNDNTNERIKIKSETNKESGYWGSMADPVLGTFDKVK